MRQTVVHAAVRRVQIGVHTARREAVPHEIAQKPSLHVVRAERLHLVPRAVHHGMVRDDHLRAEGDRLLRNALRDVQRHEDPSDLLRRIADEQADVVPGHR